MSGDAGEYVRDGSARCILSEKDGGMKTRYWLFLIDNLHRAVDEAYCACERDENMAECQEVISILDAWIKDFEALLKQLEVQKLYNTSRKDERPSSVTWEVPCSPSKCKQISFTSSGEETKLNETNFSTESLPSSPTTVQTSSGLCTLASKEDEPASVNMPVPVGVNPSSYSPQSESNASFDVQDTPPLSCNDIVEECNQCRPNSWADRSESPPFSPKHRDAHSPGRAAQIHQKLSSPLRKRSLAESIKLSEEKQFKAQQFRDKLNEERVQRSRVVSDKIRVVRQHRYSREVQHREAIEGRMVEAGRRREFRLQEIVRKAHEEDSKVNEIAFINSLEAQNKKIEVFEKHQVIEARLQDIEGERLKKREENIAKEEAAQKRRHVMEAERQAKLMELNQKRREQDAKIEQMKVQKEKQREEIAKERERRLEAHHAARRSFSEEIERKIQQKHYKSSKLYDQHIEQKKEKAVATSLRNSSSDYAPRVEVYQQKKWCTVCSVKIISEVYLLSHLRGKRHREALQLKGLSGQGGDPMSVIVPAPQEYQDQTLSIEVQERLKSGKKRARKIRNRFSTGLREHESIFPLVTGTSSKYQSKFTKLIKDINRVLDYFNQHSIWEIQHVTQLEKFLGELNRILGMKIKDDQVSFCQLGGLASISRLVLFYLDPSLSLEQTNTHLPLRPLLLALTSMELTCTDHIPNSHYFVVSNKLLPLVDVVSRYFPSVDRLHMQKDTYTPGPTHKGKDTHNTTSWIDVCGTALSVIATVISCALQSTLDLKILRDCVGYIVCTGLIDRLAEYFRTITGPFDDLNLTHLVLSGLNTLTACTACLHLDVRNIFADKSEDPTQLICTLRQTELAGILSLVYALLLHDGPPRHSFVPPILPSHVVCITTAAMKALNNAAILALRVVQNSLGAEGMSLELRHILSYLLWYCTHHKHEQLLHELILAVGYFSVLHHENQMFLLSGRSPTLLQLLCGLPFEYFSDPKLSKLLYPTLISACYDVPDNKEVLELDVNSQLICVYLQGEILDSESHTKQDTKRKCDFLGLKYRFPQDHWQAALQFFRDVKPEDTDTP